MNKIVGFFLLALLFSCSRPTANFILQQTELVAPAIINTENISVNAEEYVWDFGDGHTSQNTNATHKYYLSGKYHVKLKAIKGKKHNVKEQIIIVEPPKECLVYMETSEGPIMLQLFDETPAHRDNFLKLAEEGYYDSLLFHRVMQGFMIQAGDPESKGADASKRLGMGGPPYTINAEFVDSFFHIKGILAAARTPDAVNPQKKSSGSQFYIVHGRPVPENQLRYFESQKNIKYTPVAFKEYIEKGGTPQLDKEYTIFGQVISGLNVVDSIANVKTGPGDRPVNDVLILSTKVIK